MPSADKQPTAARTSRSRSKLRLLRVVLWLVLLPPFLFGVIAGLIYFPPVQDLLRGKVVGYLEEKIGTPVRLDHLALRFPIGLSLDGLLLLDQAGDTLLNAGNVRATADLAALLDRRIVLRGVELGPLRATIAQRPDSTFNFSYILDAFASADTIVKDTTAGWPFSMNGLLLTDVHVDLDLAPSRFAMELRLGELKVDMDDMDAAQVRFHAGAVNLVDARVHLTTVPGPAEPDTYPLLENPFGRLDISLRELALENVAFVLENALTQDSLWMELVKGELLVDSMLLADQRLRIRSVALDGIHFGTLVRNPAAVIDTGMAVAPAWLDQHDGFRYWTRGLDVEVAALSIAHGDLQMHKGSIAPPLRIADSDHMALAGIVLQAGDVVLNDQRVSLHLEEFSATGGPGPSQLRASMSVDASAAAVTLSGGTVSLDGTEIVFSASAAPGDLSVAYRTPEQVPLKAQVASTTSIAELKPALAQLGIALPEKLSATEAWNTQLLFAGTIRQVDTLRLDVIGDQGTAIHLSGDVRDPQRWPRTVFHAGVHEVTMGSGLYDVVRAYVPASTPIPQRFSGNVVMTGTGNAVDAVVDLASDLGDVHGTISASGLTDTVPDALDGDLEITNVDLSRFTGDTAIGMVSAHLLAEGRSLNGSDRSGRIELVPSQLWFQGQDLSSLRLTGLLQGDSIHADLKTDAPALAVALQVHARWPAGSDTASGAMDLRVTRLALHEMGWSPHALNVHGQWEGSGAFSSNGFAQFDLSGDSVTLFNADRSFRFEEFAVKGRLASDSSLFIVQSDALEVDYRTNVPGDSLLARTRESLLSFFQADSANHHAHGGQMDLRVALPRTEWLTELVLPKLHAIELTEFVGHYDSDAHAVDLDVDLPMLQYEKLEVVGLTVNVSSEEHALDGAVRIEHIEYDTVHVDGLLLTTRSGPGTLSAALRIQEEDAPPKYVVPVEFTRAGGEIGMHILEGLVLDTMAWVADAANMLRFTPQGVMAEHFTLSSGAQRVELVTSAEQTLVRLERFNMGTLLNIVSTEDSTAFLAGELSGEVVLPLNQSTALRADLEVKDLAVLGEQLGDLSIHAEGTGTKQYNATVHFENGSNVIDAKALYDGSQGTPSAETHADIDLADMSFLRPFVRSLLYDLSGGLKGMADLKMNDGRKNVQGDLTFSNAEIGVVRTGGRYRLVDERLLADGSGLRFDGFTVLDSLGNAFTLDGQVLTEDLSSMRFDLDLHTDAFQLVHATRASNESFYGDLFMSADVHITGTDRAPVVKGDLGILPGTDLSVVLPGSEVKLVKSEGIVEFTTDLEGTDTTRVPTDEERMRDSLQARLPKVDLDVNIHVNPQAAFVVVLDPTTGDQATFQGEGDLRFRYSPEGRMFLSGPFTISEGGYTLEFYGLVKKRFDLVPGSTVIWSGDPIGARMDIKARYISESAGYPLVANATGGLSEAERNRLQSRMPFEVIINIAGAVKKPDITFGLDLPRDYRNSYPQVDEQLDRLADKSREEERNRQVFGLLVLNSFIQDEGAGGAPSSSLASSAARSSVNGILTDQLNKVTGRYLKGVDIQLGVSTVDQTAGAATYQRTSVDYKVSKSILDERLSFEVGGSVGVDEQAVSASNVNSTRAAQYAILYDLTEDGRFRLRGFYEDAYDVYDGEITNSGIAIMHTRDFEENENARERAREEVRQRQSEEHKRSVEERRKKDRDAGVDPPPDPGKP